MHIGANLCCGGCVLIPLSQWHWGQLRNIRDLRNQMLIVQEFSTGVSLGKFTVVFFRTLLIW